MDLVLKGKVGKRIVGGEKHWLLEANKIYLEKILNSCGAHPYTYISTDSIFDKYRDKKGTYSSFLVR